MNEIPNGFTGFANMDSNFKYRSASEPQIERVEFDLERMAAVADRDRRWSWVEIDLSAIRHNVMEVKRKLRPGCRLMAVVKADAYGHGAVQCAKAALMAGAEACGVATVNEGIELREGGIKAPILIFGEPPIQAIPLLLHYNIMPAIYTTDFAIAYAETADSHGMKAPYHLAINTGMNRIGVRFDEVVPFMSSIAFHRALEMNGVFTHFATADCEEKLDFQIQFRHFMDALTALHNAGFDLGLVHCANSAAILRYPNTHFDMVRLGISLYGFHPCPETMGTIDLRPAMSVHARITDVRSVPMSEGVSYGLHYRSTGSVKICTLPLGYADGYRRNLSSRIDVLFEGQRCRQVGNICMDQCMFEVDQRLRANKPRLEPKVGDEVVIIGKQGTSCITIDEMAALADTIQHEIAIGFSHRMPRYWK